MRSHVGGGSSATPPRPWNPSWLGTGRPARACTGSTGPTHHGLDMLGTVARQQGARKHMRAGRAARQMGAHVPKAASASHDDGKAPKRARRLRVTFLLLDSRNAEPSAPACSDWHRSVAGLDIGAVMRDTLAFQRCMRAPAIDCFDCTAQRACCIAAHACASCCRRGTPPAGGTRLGACKSHMDGII